MKNIALSFFWMLQVIADCCSWDADFGVPGIDCDENEEVGGVEECSLFVCLSDVQGYTKTACDPANPDSGVVTDITLATGKTAHRFFSSDDSQLAEYEVTANETGGSTTATTMTGQAISGPAALCWMEKMLNKKLVRLIVDNKGNLRAYGLKGGLSLSQFKDTTGTQEEDFCGMEYTFSGTKRGDFCFVSPPGGDVETFLNSLL